MRRLQPLAVAALLLEGVVALSCASTVPARHGPGGACTSVRDCLYGLTCVAAEAGAKRACRYETWGQCEKAEDCLAGHTCRSGACTVQCLSDNDCEGGLCQVGECAAAGEIECVLASDCGPDRDCVAGRCEQRLSLRCFSDLDCRSTQSCIGGWCR